MVLQPGGSRYPEDAPTGSGDSQLSAWTPEEAKAFLDAFEFTGIRVQRMGYYSRPPPEAEHMVFPPQVTATHLSGVKRRAAKLFALAEPRDAGSPLILLGHPDDYQQHIMGVNMQAGSSSCTHRTAAILALMSWFQLKPERLPPTLCLNCFTHHLPHPCQDPPRDYASLIVASAAVPSYDPRHKKYAGCRTCGQTHPPTRGVCGIPVGHQREIRPPPSSVNGPPVGVKGARPQ